MTEPSEMVNVRYMVDDVDTAIDFYTKYLDFELRTSAAPAFADITRGNLRLLLSGPASSAGRPMPDGTKPGPGGWNRIHLLVDDIDAEVARLRETGAELPERHRHRPRRLPDPARRPLRQCRRAVPTCRYLSAGAPEPDPDLVPRPDSHVDSDLRPQVSRWSHDGPPGAEQGRSDRPCLDTSRAWAAPED